MKTGRQFIYYYHDGPNPEELHDPFSGLPIPKKGEVIERRGKKYEVKQPLTAQVLIFNSAKSLVKIYYISHDLAFIEIFN